MKTTEESLNYAEVNLNDWRWASKLTPEIADGFLVYLTEAMQKFVSEGRPLLNRPEPLSYDEWKVLHDLSWDIFTRIGSSQKVVCNIHVEVIRKGISSLLHWLQTDPSAKLWQDSCTTKYHHWYYALKGQMEPQLFGISSHHCKIEESRALIESLVPIAQICKYEQMLVDIAHSRFPGDKTVWEWFVKQHKNWE